MNTILTRNYDTLVAEVKAHIAADAIIPGAYWKPSDNKVGGTGCFISCLTHSDDPAPAFERFGLPEPLLRIAESIFEALPSADAKAFFAALPDAVACDGKDLSRVHWHFLAAELRALPAQIGDVKEAIDCVIVGMDLLAKGQDWPDAADAAAAAACAAANAAADAAAYAALAACAAARAAARAAADAAAAAACAAADAAALAACAAARAAALAAADAAAAAACAAARAAAYAAAHAAANAARAARADAIKRQRDTLLQLIADAPVVKVAA
jgi:hypothetical protein